jgi:hypothetical protein
MAAELGLEDIINTLCVHGVDPNVPGKVCLIRMNAQRLMSGDECWVDGCGCVQHGETALMVAPMAGTTPL